jgi:restriction system protein
MAEITRKRQGEMLQTVFAILQEYPDGLPAREVIAQAGERLGLTEFEASDYPNRPGVRRWDKTVRFTTISPVKAGWLVKERGLWILTPEGQEANKRLADPEQLMLEAVRLYRQWREATPAEQVAEPEPSDEAVEAVGLLEEAREDSWAEITAYVAAMNPYDLQHLVAALLRAMGYFVIWDAPPGPDHGIDVIAQADPLGAKGPRIKVQVKRQADRVTPEQLRAFLALLGEGDVGVFVSTGGFTKIADELGRQQERRRVTVLDVGRLTSGSPIYERIAEADRALLPLKPVHFLALEP